MIGFFALHLFWNGLCRGRMRLLAVFLCAILATSTFLSGAAHSHAHVDELVHYQTIDHHVDDQDLEEFDRSHSESEPSDLDYTDHPAELHFVALALQPVDGVKAIVPPFERLSANSSIYQGPIRAKEPDPDRLPA